MIMDSRASLASQESTTQIRMISPRPRPLHTCAVSVLVIANRAFTIAQDLNGPFGFIIKMAARLATLAGPLAYALRYQWLTMTILSFIDNRILALVDMIERVYPPSHIVFNKIDDLVRFTETLPGKFDNAVSKFPTYVDHVSFLDWGLVCSISLLNSVAAGLSYWRISKGTREKEIKVDTSSKVDHNNEPGFIHEADQSKQPSTTDIASEGDRSRGKMDSPRHIGAKGRIEKKQEKNNKKEEVESSIADNDESESNCTDDPLLELFESAWLMTSPGRNANRNYAQRSVSFTY